ncbi:MAG TPA: GAF domain-containing protein [Chthoniobacterales bacterium]|nr:GAF domain-containing protein [Chthoniobacterales bacterium]
MKTQSTSLLQDLAAYLLAAPKDPATLKRAAEMVRAERGYRWVGIYKIDRGDFVIAAGTGEEPPTYARFPTTQGLCGAVAESRETLIVADVKKDPRWLPAFWTTQSEIVVPIISETTQRVLGVIDVESDKVKAFSEDDRDFLEHVAVLMAGKLCTAKKNHNGAAR